MFDYKRLVADKVFVIAEAGVNHNGDKRLAMKLIEAAKEAGADAVKFQTFKTENLVSATAKKAEYQNKNTGEAGTQFEMIKKLELDVETHHQLMEYCNQLGILFLSTPFDYESCDLLCELGLPYMKVPSGEITNSPFVRYIAKKMKPMIISTGMANLAEVQQALDVVYETGNKEVAILHCTTEYPAPIHETNLRAMQTMREAFKVPVGYSDHTLGYDIPLAAVAMGAKIIEKHFTLDKTMEGPDHKASLEPHELKAMMEAIRSVESALGDGIKRPAPSELKNMEVARKSLVLACDVEKGTVLTEDMIRIKRPGNGITPGELDKVVGMTIQKSLKRDQVLRWEDFKSS